MSCGEKENIQRASDMPAARLGDELWMMSLARGQYFRLNAVGTRIWELLAEPTTDAALQERGLLAKGVA
jgi:hypothetical protein